MEIDEAADLDEWVKIVIYIVYLILAIISHLNLLALVLIYCKKGYTWTIKRAVTILLFFTICTVNNTNLYPTFQHLIIQITDMNYKKTFCVK